MKNICLVASFFCLFSCGTEPDVFTTKPRAYHRIELPPAAYQAIDQDLPYQFEHSIHAMLKPHVSFITENEYYWMDLYYPDFQATIHLGYKMINDQKAYENFVNDAHKLAGKHIEKATKMSDFIIKTPSGFQATVFELSGNLPTPFQFFFTDTTTHYLRGALYFNYADKNDSIAPIIEYIKHDMIHMLNTMRFTYTQKQLNEKIKMQQKSAARKD